MWHVRGTEEVRTGFWCGEGHEVRRLLGRPRHRWDDINMDLQEVGSGHVLDLSGLGYGQVAGLL